MDDVVVFMSSGQKRKGPLGVQSGPRILSVFLIRRALALTASIGAKRERKRADHGLGQGTARAGGEVSAHEIEAVKLPDPKGRCQCGERLASAPPDLKVGPTPGCKAQTSISAQRYLDRKYTLMPSSIKKAAGRVATAKSGARIESTDTSSVRKLKGKATARKAKRQARSLR